LAWQFNLYLALATLLGFCGCQTIKKSPTAALRVHIETTPDPAGASQTIPVLRSNPVLVTIKNEPVLTEANIVSAEVIEAVGGFALKIKFDENGTWLLEQYSAANPGGHLVIYGQWGNNLTNGRWLADPVISHRISNGTLVFTADCEREEADQLVLGLNNFAKNLHHGFLK
jgi:hypothetical protein